MTNAIIDLSHFQTVADFNAVKNAGIAALIHKATQGTQYVDPTFADKRTRATDAGLLFGAYHFGTAGDAVAQADHLLEIAGADTLLVLDFEGNPQGQDMSLYDAEQFVHHIFTSTGRYPGFYSGHSIKEAIAKAGITNPQDTEVSKCWLWISQYAPAPVIPKIWSAWTMWQYTDGAVGNQPHTVDGVGHCDRDIYNGTLDELTAFWSPAPPAASGFDATRIVNVT